MRSSVLDPWHFGRDPGPSLFVSDLQDANKKIIVFTPNVFLLLLFEGTFTSFFKDKKS